MSEQKPQVESEGGIGQSASTGGLGCQGINDTSPACPHCGYKHDDAWEWNFGPGLEGTSNARECYRCGGVFDCERVVDVSYTTWVPNGGGERGRACATSARPTGSAANCTEKGTI